jgi:hypothetical protein
MTLAAAATNNTSAAWFTLAGALGGILLTGALALITAVLNHRWKEEEEHETFARELTKDLREKRQSTYQEYWASFAILNSKQKPIARAIEKGESPDSDIVKAALESEESAFDDWWKYRIAVMLIGGEDVRKALDRHLYSLRSLRHSLREKPYTILPDRTKEVDHAGDELFKAMRAEITN